MSKEKLQKLYKSLTTAEPQFSPGQIVEWKPGLQNKKAYGPFVVIEVLDPPRINDEPHAGSPYFKEPLDVILGHLDDDGDFMCYHYDSRRLQPVTE